MTRNGQVGRGKIETGRNDTYPTEFSTPSLQQEDDEDDDKTDEIPFAQRRFFQTKTNPFLLVHVGLAIHGGVHWQLSELQLFVQVCDAACDVRVSL